MIVLMVMLFSNSRFVGYQNSVAIQEIFGRRQRHVFSNCQYVKLDSHLYISSSLTHTHWSIARLPPWCHTFDLNRTITQSDLEAVQLTTLSLSESSLESATDKFKKLYTTLNKLIYKYNTEMIKSPPGKILRIGLPSLGSPMWGASTEERVRMVKLN